MFINILSLYQRNGLSWLVKFISIPSFYSLYAKSSKNSAFGGKRSSPILWQVGECIKFCLLPANIYLVEVYDIRSSLVLICCHIFLVLMLLTLSMYLFAGSVYLTIYLLTQKVLSFHLQDRHFFRWRQSSRDIL